MNRRNFITRITALAAAMGVGGKAVAEKSIAKPSGLPEIGGPWHINTINVPFAAEKDGAQVTLDSEFVVEYTFEMQTKHVPSSDGSLINLEFIAPDRAKLVWIRDITDPLNPIVISEA